MRREIICASLEMPEEERVLKLCSELLKEFYFIDEDDSDGWRELVTRAREASNAAKGTIAEQYATAVLIATLDHVEHLSKVRNTKL